MKKATGFGKLIAAVVVAVTVTLSGIRVEAETARSGGYVRPGDTIQPLRSARELPARSSVSPARDRLQLVGYIAAGLGLVGCLAFVYRRRRRGRLGVGTSGDDIRLVDRLALSPRHSVWVLRVRDRELVVGVTPDNISTLAVFDRPSSVHAGAEGVSPLTLDSAVTAKGGGGDPYWFRPHSESRGDDPEDGESCGGNPSSSKLTDDLTPYRREVTRLRSLLQNWRSGSEGERFERSP